MASKVPSGDIMQDVRGNLWPSSDQINPTGLEKWLIVIAVSNCTKTLRTGLELTCCSCLQVSQEQIRSPELRSYRSAEPSYMLTSTFVASGENEAADIPTLFPHSQGGAKRWGREDVQPTIEYCILRCHTNCQWQQFPTGRLIVINATNDCRILGQLYKLHLVVI